MEKVIVIIRDGWGFRRDGTDNAVCEAKTPNMDYLLQHYPHTLLKTDGEAVGLPPGYMGNSEVGHITIGSGRILFQSLVRINKSIVDGDFFSKEALQNAIRNCKQHGTALHLIGILQVEGVHGHLDHLLALLGLCKREEFHAVWLHIITDGRDAPVTDSLKHLATLQKKMAETGVGRIATVSGRFYAMDRDKRWDRTKKAYDAIVHAQGASFTDAGSLIAACHAKQEFDEFIIPHHQESYLGIAASDAVIFYNFRTDRTRQLTQAMIDEQFPGWERKPLQIMFVAMTQFYAGMPANIVFEDQSLANLLGEVVSKEGLKQLRISETEKYPHVTFFFNGQVEQPYPGEKRIVIPSPKVETYDMKPEMSVYEITQQIIPEIASGEHHLIVVNLVNCDMVGHTGVPFAVRRAVECVDECTERIVEAGLAHGYASIVFADHGNAEDQTDEYRTSHTLNPITCILASANAERMMLKKGRGLQDIAPTVLDLLGVEKPAEMTGESLIIRS